MFAHAIGFGSQIQAQFDRVTTGPLASQLGDLLNQMGVDVKDVMSALRQGSNFIGGFRTNVLQNIQQRGTDGCLTWHVLIHVGNRLLRKE